MKFIPLALLALSACSSPHILSATPAGGIVTAYGWQPAKSLQIAQSYCAKLGKSARVSGENELQDHMMFECV